MKKIVITLVLSAVFSLGISALLPERTEDFFQRAELTQAQEIMYKESVRVKGVVTGNLEDGYIVNGVVSEEYVKDLKEGQEAEIKGRGFAETYTGKLLSIAENAESEGADSFVRVAIKVNEKDGSIRSGYTAETRIFISGAEKITAVPYEALKKDNDNSEYVYVFADGKAEKRTIVTGRETPDGIEAVSGVAVSEKLLLPENENFREGKYVKIND